MEKEDIRWSRRLLDALEGEQLLTEEAFGPDGEVDQTGVRFGYGELVKMLIARKLSVATMESCTGGQIASLLTDTEGLSEVFRGGFVSDLAENAALNVAASVIMVVVAALFLLVDFDEIKRSVDEDLPKKYEWSAAFGLAFGVIWLFFKILELLGRDITHGTSAFRASVGASIAVCDVNWKDLF